MSSVYQITQLPFPFFTVGHAFPGCTCSGKSCTGCQQTQCYEHFHRHVRSKDGYRSECKTCRKAQSQAEEFKAKRRAYHKEHAEEINAKKRAWTHAHAERVSLASKKSRIRRSEQLKVYTSEYNRSERGKQRVKRYRSNHPEKVRQVKETWIANNPDKAQEYAKVRSANYKAKKLGIAGRITAAQWRELKKHYNNTCLRCKQQEPIINLTLDHVIPFALRGRNDITNVQPLCDFCNTSKGVKVVDYRIDYQEQMYG